MQSQAFILSPAPPPTHLPRDPRYTQAHHQFKASKTGANQQNAVQLERPYVFCINQATPTTESSTCVKLYSCTKDSYT